MKKEREAQVLGPQKTHLTNFNTLEKSGLGKRHWKGPMVKKLKRTTEDSPGPPIKSDNFPKSSIFPHLKLKELARRKGFCSPSNSSSKTEGNTWGGNSYVFESTNATENIVMSEEAGLTTPPTQP